jgi:hypothetical protein
MPADHSVVPARRRRPLRPSPLSTTGAAAVLVIALAGCGGGHASAGPTTTVTAAAGPSSASASASASTAATPPGLVAITAAGALVVLNPATGAPSATLVPSGVIGDEVSVSAGGTVYFTQEHGCTEQIESVGLAGGTPVVITAGSLPALSPDGTRLAFTTEPNLDNDACIPPPTTDITAPFKLVVRTLATGAEVSYPMTPKSQDSGLPAPISHLSWASDNDHLAVSISSIEDNEGWNLVLVNTAVARYYLSGGPGLSYVMPSGPPTPQQSYLREGIYLPDGNLFISRACCAGVPPRNTSRLMWVVNAAGTLVRQVAVGFPNLDHISLSANRDGSWLLYVAGGSLYVSKGGATPRQIATHLAAAAWS